MTACEFCGVYGDRPECEGILLGPFKSKALKHTKEYFIHRNCATWAPEVYEPTSKEGTRGALCGVEKAITRSRPLNCSLCGGKGPSLSCMYLMTHCCLPMHFRCALISGAALMAFGNVFHTLCPKHIRGTFLPNAAPHIREVLHVQTPVFPEDMSLDHLCHICKEDNFKTSSGGILRCSSCERRMHSMCVTPKIYPDGVFAVDAADGKFRCNECLICLGCKEKIPAPARATGRAADSKIMRCIGCKTAGVHISCLETSGGCFSRTEADGPVALASLRASRGLNSIEALSKLAVVRCEACRSCRHCGLHRVDTCIWNEKLAACASCAELYRLGFPKGHVCPICDKIDREEEDVDMIFCEVCNCWVHALDCCGLTYDEFVRLEQDESSTYVCPRCHVSPRKKRAPKKIKKSQSLAAKDRKFTRVEERAEENGLLPTAEEILAAEEAAEEAAAEATEAAKRIDIEDLDEEANQDAVLWVMNAQKMNFKGDSNPVPELVPQRDLCRACGSGGDDLCLRFCSDCGESVHGFCIPANLPTRLPRAMTATLSIASRRRLSFGSSDGTVDLWRCPRCVVCYHCTKGPSGDMADPSAFSPLPLYRCTHCDVYSHVQCVPLLQCEKGSENDSFFDHDMHTMLCADCQRCELCRKVCSQPVQVQNIMFCVSCADLLRTAKPCSLCTVKYPSMPPVESLTPLSTSKFVATNIAEKRDEQVSIAHNVTPEAILSSLHYARLCDECNSVVHASCASNCVLTKATFVCEPCLCALPFVSEFPSVKSICNDEVDKPGLSVAELGDIHADGEQVLTRGMNIHGNVTTDVDRDHNENTCCGTSNEDAVVIDSDSESESESDVDNAAWTLNASNDERLCEFCGGKEESNCQKGRLIPWVGEKSVWWVHAMCALWSPCVKRQIGVTETGVRVCFLVASRREVSQAIRTGICAGCERDGATIACVTADCDSAFHFSCAEEAGCVMQARTLAEDNDVADASITDRSAENDVIDLAAVSGLAMLCVQCSDGSDISTVADDCSAGSSVTLSSGRRLDLNQSVRFYAAAKRLMNRKRASTVDGARYSLRVGGLSVLRPGVVVPNSALFLQNGVLIPNEYHAARRHWSIKCPGLRCTYLLSTSGSARTGPSFSIRASDDPDLLICAPSAAAAWNIIVYVLQSVRSFNPGMFGFEGSLFVCTPGNTVFGFKDSAASVSILETLPNSHLFQGRYEFQYFQPLAPLVSAIPFALPDISLHQIPLSRTGCARSEGYLPARYRAPIYTKNSLVGNGPSYANVQTGEWFQLHVAMGLGQVVQRKADKPGADAGLLQAGELANGLYGASVDEPCGSDAIVTPAVASDAVRGVSGRVSKTRVSGGGVGMSGVVDGTRALLPYSMQHRAMLSTWQRRTVVLRSRIEGWGVFATEDINAQEMVIEYAGEVIRPVLSDKREKHYDSKGIGCYMFEVAPGVIVDATVTGNRARYINHSCDPNCFSRTVTVENGRRVIVIFSKRIIKRGEELCYDYQFPFDDNDRVRCACGSARCKGWMN
jgi:ribosomal protein L37AE/L43A